jgi:hypothetical protein
MKAYPRKPPCGHDVHGRHGLVSPVKNRWRFLKFRRKKKMKLWPSLQKSLTCKKMGFKSSHWSCLKAWFKGYKFCSTTFLVRPSTGAQLSHETSPKKRSNDLERSKFRQQVQSFVCVPPWRRVTFKFWEMLKNTSEVTLAVSTKNIIFLKILNLVQSFVECKVSLSDGMYNTHIYIVYIQSWFEKIVHKKSSKPHLVHDSPHIVVEHSFRAPDRSSFVHRDQLAIAGTLTDSVRNVAVRFAVAPIVRPVRRLRCIPSRGYDVGYPRLVEPRVLRVVTTGHEAPSASRKTTLEIT